jgi:hypothetical protein
MSRNTYCQAAFPLCGVLISEFGIYAASPFKAIRASKRAKARAPSARTTALKLLCSGERDGA